MFDVYLNDSIHPVGQCHNVWSMLQNVTIKTKVHANNLNLPLKIHFAIVVGFI